MAGTPLAENVVRRLLLAVRLDTLKQHYEKWWPRDTAQVHATYATLDPRLNAPAKRIGSAA